MPGQGEGLTFQCPKCRLAHPWSAEHAGKTARCGCGYVLKVPAWVDGAPAQPAPAAAHSAAAPLVDYAGPTDEQMPAFLRASGGATSPEDELPPEIEAELAATGKYGEADPNVPDPKRDFHIPVAMLVIGFLLTGADFAFRMHANPGIAMAAGMFAAGVKLILGMIFMLGGALVAAKFSGINFGPIGPALLKLAALCLAPTALGDFATTLLGGDMAVAQLGWLVRIILYWGFVSYLFRLDGGQTAVVVGTISVVKIVAGVILASMLFLSLAPSVPTPRQMPSRFPAGRFGAPPSSLNTPAAGAQLESDSAE